MQPMTGIEFLHKVRASKTLKHLQFIMVTTESKTSYIIIAKDAGASNYIVKPFHGNTLKEKFEIITAYTA